MTFNEGKACDAVIRVLEIRVRQIRGNLRFPEQEGHAAPIELTCHLGNRLFAIEHTGIEPFHGHVQLQNQAATHFDPIRAMLKGKLPPNETFELMIPAKATQDIRKRNLPDVQAKLAAWVEATAPTLPLAPFCRYDTSQRNVRPPGVPFEVSLYRFQWMGSPFSISHAVSGLEASRELRIQEACARKFPKLDAWCKSSGARTVLILEDNDSQSSPKLVFDTLIKVENRFSDRPDEIYLVWTAIENPWYVWALRVGNHGYYDLVAYNRSLEDVDPRTLVDLTRR
jgi:hypothetical protein